MDKFTEETVMDAIFLNPHAFGVVGWDKNLGWHGDVINLHLEGGKSILLSTFTKILNNLIEGGASFQKKEGEVVVTTNESGECILVSRQDEDHKILKVIWEKK